METTELIEFLYEAFANAPRPGRNEITPHRCWECDEARDRLEKYESRMVPTSDMEWLGDCLPLLGPRALRYYLPRYLEFSITDPGSNAGDGVLYFLAPNNPVAARRAGQCSQFSERERQAVVNYLNARATWDNAEFEREYLERALHFWSRRDRNV